MVEVCKTVQVFYFKISNKNICSGRYDIKVYQNYLSLHGKTYDYKIPIRTIMRLFLLPHKDGRHMYFVVIFHLFCSFFWIFKQKYSRMSKHFVYAESYASFFISGFLIFTFKISLNPPIRQGQTRYHFLVLEFSKDEEVDLDLGLTS